MISSSIPFKDKDEPKTLLKQNNKACLKGRDGLHWKEALTGATTPDHSLAKSREFQDAIFTRRSNSPLVMPFLYKIMRNRLETEMIVSTESHVKEFESTLQKIENS